MGIRPAVAALLAAVAPLVLAAADESTVLNERVKAAFLAKFAAYVEWPTGTFDSPSSPIVIGVASADAIAVELENAVSGRNVAGRSLTVRRLAANEDAASCCHVLFVGARHERGRAADLLAHAQGHPVLTVTDRQGDHPRGSVINFVFLDDRVRFDIARDAAERNGLQLRSQLLGVARQVRLQ
jgi:hypothetical protein